ncbi:hypothetical protein FO675_10895 [Riemerella anatipestifer]|nr:hypothetical protein [Riemerella anatipestifer]
MENEFKPFNILFVRFGFSFFYNAKIQLYFGSVIFSSVACNGKSICEGRTKLNLSFNFDQP